MPLGHATEVRCHRSQAKLLWPQKKEKTMIDHKAGRREDWLAARRELLEAEKRHVQQGDELARRRQELPWVPIEKQYVFETADGKKTLDELFEGRSQLLIYHFMFGFGFRVTSRIPDAPAALSSPITSTASSPTSTATTWPWWPSRSPRS